MCIYGDAVVVVAIVVSAIAVCSGGGDADMCTRNSVSGSGRNRSISRCDSGRNNSR